MLQSLCSDLIVTELRSKLRQSLLLLFSLHQMYLGLVLIRLFLKIELLVLGDRLSCQLPIEVRGPTR